MKTKINKVKYTISKYIFILKMLYNSPHLLSGFEESNLLPMTVYECKDDGHGHHRGQHNH